MAESKRPPTAARLMSHAGQEVPLALGTVQLGMAYGTVCPSLPPGAADVELILDAAWQHGIRIFDTARGYGAAESRLGAWIARRGADAFVISKSGPADDAAAFEASLAASRAALGAAPIGTYLMHRAPDLFRPGIADTLRRLVAGRVIGGFGVSVYTPDEIGPALDVAGLTDIEAPLSVFDRRIVASGALAAAARRGVRVWARSVFLQGVLLEPPDRLPPHFAALALPIAELRSIAGAAAVPLIGILLGAVRRTPGLAGAIVAVQNIGQLRQLLAEAALPAPADAIELALRAAANVGPDLLDPRHWPQDMAPARAPKS